MEETKIIVTLGRQFGSGGQQAGQRLAALLGIAYYDREIIEEMAAHSGLAPEYVERHDERAPGFFDYALAGRLGIGQGHLYGSSHSFVNMSQTLKEVADRGSCLIVGRAADYVLRNEKGLIRIFIHAPFAYRVRFLCKERGISADEAARLLQRHDRERARFYDFFTDRTWGQADTYDLSIDISRLGEEDTAQFLAQYVELRRQRF